MRMVLGNGKKQPLISICMTTYNVVNTLKINVLLIEKYLKDIPHEIVIVDNYSEDGTYDEIMKLKQRFSNIIFVQYKCSRGLGKRIATKLARGKYVYVIVDPDNIVNSKYLKELIDLYLKMPFKDKKAWGLLMPKNIIEHENWYNLNRAEDNEFVSRLMAKGLMVYVPIQLNNKPYLKYERRGVHRSWLLPRDIFRELRYARQLHYLKRFVNNKLDMICGSGYTLSKVIREYFFLKRLSLLHALISTLYHLLWIALAKILKRKILSYDKYLSNYIYPKYAMIRNIYIPRNMPRNYRLRLLINRKEIEYISRYYPDIIDELLKLRNYVLLIFQ